MGSGKKKITEIAAHVEIVGMGLAVICVFSCDWLREGRKGRKNVPGSAVNLWLKYGMHEVPGDLHISGRSR